MTNQNDIKKLAEQMAVTQSLGNSHYLIMAIFPFLFF